MSNLETKSEETKKVETTVEKEEVESTLTLVDSIEVNSNLTVNFYSKDEQTIVGLEHFKFEEEVLLRGETLKKITDLFSLHEKEKDLKKSLKKSGFKR